MTVEELKARPEYVTLGPQQQQFVVAYCTNGADKLAAAKAAYTAQNDDSALAIANRNLRHTAIRGLVNAFYNRTEETGSKVEAMAILWKQAQDLNGDPKLRLEYLKFLAELKGWTKTAEPDNPETDYAAAVAALKET